MNIFVLDNNPKIAAQYHTDKHVVKMILETAQLLSTAHHILDTNSNITQYIYKKTHYNHPCAVWVRENSANYLWALDLLKELLLEYEHRYNKIHLTKTLLPYLSNPPINIKPSSTITSFAQAMPDTYKKQDSVAAYRTYYLWEKRDLFNWTKREMPEWIKEEIKNENENSI